MKKSIQIRENLILDNILKSDLHMHTVYCDGQNTPEEMVISAIEKGLSVVGFSGHSFVKEEPELGMNEEETSCYVKEIGLLKKKYSGKIAVLCGIEQDYLSETKTDGYDYVIGSVHYIESPEGPVAVDDTPEILKKAVEKYYGGDFYAAAENYFSQVADVVNKTGADIIGHFDLFSKFNQKEGYFDENNVRYAAAWKAALDKLIPLNKVFEINTGGISRGWKDEAYPAPDMIDYIKAHGGKFILSSDSHNRENIGFQFEQYMTRI